MTLDDWMATAATSLDVDLSTFGDLTALRTQLLDVARDAAHGVARPAAPLTTFVLGVAVGQGMDVVTAAALIRRALPEPNPPEPNDARAADA